MINFSKMHGAGNDFIIIKAEEIKGVDYSMLARKVCDRHFGIGADGMMVVEDSQRSDIKMIYYNSDGSQGEMCGNGIRCFSKFVYEKGIVKRDVFLVETLAGIKEVKLTIGDDDLVEKILVDMGKPILKAESIPVITQKEIFINEIIKVGDSKIIASSILMGVPHTIIFVNEIKENDVYKLGPQIEKHDIYPKNTNVNFVNVINNRFIEVDTWERGAGKTLACGTGVCASVYAAYHLKYVGKSVDVHVPGGRLNIYIDDDNRVFMEGTAKFICDGKYYSS
ncbi:diaminopimelate epimerase [Paramaledivibacter caminithermalis]|jgi:diaminopimelate epimerase|uniref:Diaminopimelate epimerase n=1 Tax=Paramaledivibacter caminithermalis (strain DSM 15212 / CIP 107654 / DViRD3) TaxID=1121301 RepID=A0A1M6NGY7_PARC5|nr:diaminopimelate epimerase [Paramaledivibacter caminithermalis]SHJ94896.1 diaminopimelate epimerase [Paramaledivibacter caminithermalis DSM 15212]